MRLRSGKKAELLKNIWLFSACTAKELNQVAALATEIEVATGHVLTKEGAPGRECFVVVEGEAKCTIRGRKVATYGTGEIFGEMALLDEGPRVATITAQTPMRLLVLDSRSFSSLLDQVPPVAKKVLKTLAQRLREAERSPSH